MGVAKSDFSHMHRSRSDSIKNAERFARIDLDRSRFEKERNHCITVACTAQALCMFTLIRDDSKGVANLSR